VGQLSGPLDGRDHVVRFAATQVLIAEVEVADQRAVLVADLVGETHPLTG
jgi:hypothetical protein